LDGKGILYYGTNGNEGKRYIGEWKNNLKHGRGRLLSKNNTPEYVGEWKNG
jgi:hypothetical protein